MSFYKKSLPEPTYKPIQTPLGVLHGRDAVLVENLFYDPQDGGLLRITGQLDGASVTLNPQGLAAIPFTLSFDDVQAFTVTQVDTYGYGGGSVRSFDQVFHSRWRYDLMNRHSTTITGRHTHYHLRTYDDVFDILCESFELLLDLPD